MSAHDRPDALRARRTSTARLRELVRVAAIVVSLIALLLTSSAPGLVDRVDAANPKRAVIVAGPVHNLTDKYKGYAKAIANAAEAEGFAVTRIFHPKAPASRVKKHANGADLFVYVGHGNGWPSPYPPFQEKTKNGLGLNPQDPDKRTTSNVVYKGADWLKANIEFAPNAVVILSHLSYASGNASSGMPIPSRSVAVERVDNFANGFLAAGARVVWALGWQPGADVVKALANEQATMDAVFQTQYRSGVNPLNGWIGWKPGYYDSLRTPGATIHIDPDQQYGFLRAVTGDLEFTTNEWRDSSSVPDDTTPPVVSDVSAQQSSTVVATGGIDVPVFTPNGDGISDTIKIGHSLSESAFLDVRISRGDTQVRHMSVWAQKGRGSITWNGKNDDGQYEQERRYVVEITPRDRAGNVGEPASTTVKILSSLKSPAVRPSLFDATDGDALASSTAFTARLTRTGTVSWIIKDRNGNVVRRGIDAVEMEPGPVRFGWDGRDDRGELVGAGRYTGRVQVTRPNGTYGHEVSVRNMPFWLRSSDWTVKRGQTIKLRITAAEPIQGKIKLVVNAKGVRTQYPKVIKTSAKTFKATVTALKGGQAGYLKIYIAGTDKNGGHQHQRYKLRLR